MGSELALDDLQIDMYVTMLCGRKHEERIVESSGFVGGIQTISAFEDHSFRGAVLQIVAIDLPFAVVMNRSETYFTKPITFDMRDGWKFKKLTKEYVDVVLKRNNV